MVSFKAIPLNYQSNKKDMNYNEITNANIQAFISSFGGMIVKKIRRYKSRRQFCVSFHSATTDHGVVWVTAYDDMWCMGFSMHSNNFSMPIENVPAYMTAFDETVQAIAELEDMGIACATKIVAAGELGIVGDHIYTVITREKDFVYLIDRKDGNKCSRLN